ncbi:MAG: Holliday junction branch migration protein RuvA [Pelagibacterales bacterium]|nr:Holliday junction branch migration protein RuvA [Pelagibacterales bacterium]
MIASLNGILTLIGKSEIVLEVNGVGYFLNVSSKLIASLDEIGSKLTLFTDLQIKDDKIVMYGFASSKDQNIFKLLQTVQGVGPKAALSILSTLNVDEIILAITSGDKAMISRADGIGPRVAGRITTELVEKVINFNNNISNNFIDKNLADIIQVNSNLNKDNDIPDLSVAVEDSISALVNLGYSRSEVFPVVMKIKNDNSLNANKNFTVSEIIPIALKELSGRIE